MLFDRYLIIGILLLISTLGLSIVMYKQHVLIRRYRNLLGDSKRLRNRYSDFVDLLPQTVLEIDTNGLIRFLNSAGYEFLGINKYDFSKGVNIKDLIIKEQRKRFHHDLMYILEGGLNKGQEYSLINKKGTSYSIVIYFSQIINKKTVEGLRGIIIDASQRKKLERKAFSAVIETEERERKRYSEDLHDGLGPLLSTIKLYINQLNQESVTEQQKEETLSFTNDLIDEAISTTRTIANNILPSTIEDNGLWAAVVSFCKNIEKTGAIKFDLINNTSIKFKTKAQTNIYRVLIELINNTLKHAHATKIGISFEMHDVNLKIIYSDNGLGLNENKNLGLGVSNIKNRSNSLNAQFRFFNDEGMRFELIIPIEELTINIKKEQYV